MKRFLLISLMLGSACAFFAWSMIELKREMDRQTVLYDQAREPLRGQRNF